MGVGPGSCSSNGCYVKQRLVSRRQPALSAPARDRSRLLRETSDSASRANRADSWLSPVARSDTPGRQPVARSDSAGCRPTGPAARAFPEPARRELGPHRASEPWDPPAPSPAPSNRSYRPSRNRRRRMHCSRRNAGGDGRHRHPWPDSRAAQRKIRPTHQPTIFYGSSLPPWKNGILTTERSEIAAGDSSALSTHDCRSRTKCVRTKTSASPADSPLMSPGCKRAAQHRRSVPR
jgi:hypothetical protein